jgi:hypothetical protein
MHHPEALIAILRLSRLYIRKCRKKSDSQGAGEQRSARFRSDNGFDLHRFIWAIQTRQRSILNFLSFPLSDYAYTPRLASIQLDDPEPSTSCLESSELSDYANTPRLASIQLDDPKSST